MFLSSQAIVVSKVRHTDNTAVVTLYTKQAGSVGFVVRRPNGQRGAAGVSGSRRRVGQGFNLLQPLTLVHIEWDHRPTATLQHIREVRLLAEPQACQGADGLTQSLISEVLTHALRQENSGELFPFLVRTLYQDNSYNSQSSNLKFQISNFKFQISTLIFLAQLASHLGIEPNVESPTRYFDLLNGEYADRQPSHRYYVEGSDAKFVSLLFRLTYSTGQRLHLSPHEHHRALRGILTYYRLHLPNFPELRTLAVMKEMILSGEH